MSFNSLFTIPTGYSLDKTKKDNKFDYLYQVNPVKHNTKEYKSVIRFLPNLKTDMTLGDGYIKKTTHYVNFSDNLHLNGTYDCQKSFGGKCPLCDIYWKMYNGDSAVGKIRVKDMKPYNYYYSYVLVLEDKQQKDMEGKVKIFRYGKRIYDKIQQQIQELGIEVFDLITGKDFVLVVKTEHETFPNYDNSIFKESSTIKIPEGNGTWKTITHSNGVMEEESEKEVIKLLLKREKTLEELMSKKWTEEQENNVEDIINILQNKDVRKSRDNKGLGVLDVISDDGKLVKTKVLGVLDEDDDFFN